MRYEVLNIDIDYAKIGVENNGFQPTLTIYIPDNSREIDINRIRPMVIVCPGGGYGWTSDREAEPVALKFLAAGMNTAVLRYTTGTDIFPAPQLELAEAVATVRKNAPEWNIDPDRIIICGFSAGGHLAASFGTLWNRDMIGGYLGYHKGEHKPNGLILGYPVITAGQKTHRGSFINLLGERKDDPALLELLSAEKQVDANTPPTFLWHTFSDGAVPVENSLLFAQALAANGIPTELHIFPNGPHGLSLSNRLTASDQAVELMVPECEQWIDMAVRWIQSLR